MVPQLPKDAQITFKWYHYKITMSTMEAEYNALSITMRELLPFKHLVETVARMIGLDVEDPTPFKSTVWEDNVRALTVANMEPGRITPRSKFKPSRCIGSEVN
jgi:hypothetical protein